MSNEEQDQLTLTTTVPEPTTMLLFGLVLIGLAGVRRVIKKLNTDRSLHSSTLEAFFRYIDRNRAGNMDPAWIDAPWAPG